ncbi:peptidyl-prolyl cis-trans isomerase [Ectothiorhodospiraceae bacterium WFHF3C12]|nr:peptidyl-prolyl cis-trans isomerase [Ectothiorhodospiraceae bacterium WFHF3C12]
MLGMAVAGGAQGAEAPRVKFETSKGPIILELYPDKAPRTVENFLAYVEQGFYDGTIFHRVIPGFVIQGGGFTADYERKTTREPITNESDNGLDNARGTISMARTRDPHSATSQFFINLSDNDNLDHRGSDWGYAVFGKVVDGMEVVDAIAGVPTGAAGPFRSDAPRNVVMIESATRVPAGGAGE